MTFFAWKSSSRGDSWHHRQLHDKDLFVQQNHDQRLVSKNVINNSRSLIRCVRNALKVIESRDALEWTRVCRRHEPHPLLRPSFYVQLHILSGLENHEEIVMTQLMSDQDSSFMFANSLNNFLKETHIDSGSLDIDGLSRSRDIRWKESIELHVVFVPLHWVENFTFQIKDTSQN